MQPRLFFSRDRPRSLPRRDRKEEAGMTETFHERYKSPIPTRELERRWRIAQAAMRQEGIDCILTQNTTQYIGGYNRWLTDTTAENAYPQSVILPQQGELALIAYGAPPQNYYPPKYVVRGGTVRRNVPYFAPFNFTHEWEGMIALEWVREQNIKRFGIAGMGLIHTAYFESLRRALPGVEFVDASELLDGIRSRKSEDEVRFLRRSAAIADKAMGYVRSLVRPGVCESEMRAKLMQILTDHGGEEQIVIIGSAPADGQLQPVPSFLQNRTLAAGDQAYICLIASGPGGYFTSLGRMVSLGPPPASMEAAWRTVKEAQALMASHLRPGALPADVFQVYEEFLAQHGCRPERSLFAYGQGYDWIERPSIRPDETMEIAPGMCFAVHTSAVSPDQAGFGCDTYLVGEQATERLHGTPECIITI